MAKKKAAAAAKDLIESEFFYDEELKKPFENLGRQITRLQMKPPIPIWIRKFGRPYTPKEHGAIPNDEIAAKYIEKLGGLSKDGSNQMGAADFIKATNGVMLFFVELES